MSEKSDERISYNVRETDGITVIELSGEIDMYTCPKIRDVIMRIIDRGKYNIILELSRAEYFETSFIGLINEVLKKCKDNEGALKLLNPCAYLKRVIDLMHLDYFHDIYYDEKIALDSFKENITNAVLKWKQVVGMQPEYPDAHFHLALAMKSSGSFEDALSELQKAVDINPRYSKAFKVMGDIYHIKNMQEKAIESYQKAISLNPQYADALIGLGRCYKDNTMIDEAISHYEKALDANPEYADIHNSLGCAYLEKGRFNDARNCFERAIEINIGYVDAHFNLADSWLKEGKEEEAVEIFKKIIASASSEYDKEKAHKRIKELKRTILRREE